ncbi:hypothetical protein U1Q18_005299, partial [Sarracenia purpurea var. burkii]
KRGSHSAPATVASVASPPPSHRCTPLLSHRCTPLLSHCNIATSPHRGHRYTITPSQPASQHQTQKSPILLAGLSDSCILIHIFPIDRHLPESRSQCM